MKCTCSTCSGNGNNEAIVTCEKCGTSFCLSCAVNHHMDPQTGRHQGTWHSPDGGWCCQECNHSQKLPDTCVLSEVYWQVRGITNFVVYMMVYATLITAAEAHWE